ncbi:MAG TPA: uracil-DNA glycosylase family protein [Ktedonobacterales bacterium]|jgi:uracil-DNA glycosylase
MYEQPPGQALSLEERAARLEALMTRVQACRLCQERGYLAEANPVGASRGHVTDQVMVIGQAPGRQSVIHRIPFGGPGGKVLQSWFVRAGFQPEDFHERIYLSALTRCDPGRNPRGTGDRKPSPAEQALCRPYLVEELALVRPRVLILLGGLAIQVFWGAGTLEEIIGTYREQDGQVLLPWPHPSGASRWLNDSAHQALLSKAIEHLARWRVEFKLDQR